MAQAHRQAGHATLELLELPEVDGDHPQPTLLEQPPRPRRGSGHQDRPVTEQDDVGARRLREALVELLPMLADTRVTHAWGGCLGVPRDWCASVGLDRGTGLAWAGGYVGDGVSTTNLAGRTLRDLILRRDSDLVRLPWVDHRSPRWEPEPLRWLGVNAGLRAMAAADVEERLTGRPSRIAGLVSPLVG